MQDLRQGLNILSGNKELASFSGPKPPELLDSAELALGVALPPTYRAFLTEVGCGDIAGCEFYGVIDDNFENSSIPDAIWLTLEERRASGLPHSLVIVYEFGEGTYVALDTSKADKEGECPVVAWVPDLSDVQDLEVIAKDYGEFFVKTIRSNLDSVE